MIEFFAEHPFIAWNIVGVTFLFIYPVAFWLFFVLSIVGMMVEQKRNRELLEAQKQHIIDEAQAFVSRIRETKKIPVISSRLCCLRESAPSWMRNRRLSKRGQ